MTRTNSLNNEVISHYKITLQGMSVYDYEVGKTHQGITRHPLEHGICPQCCDLGTVSGVEIEYTG
jgi:hypothetical protein